MACETQQFYRSIMIEKNFENTSYVKALSHGAIFLATCNAIPLLGDVKLANTCSITVC